MNRSTTRIRKVKAGDIPAIYKIELQSFKDPYSPLLLMKLLALFPSGFYAAVNGGKIVGYTLTRRVGQKGHIIALATDKAFQNKHVGTMLLRNILELFRQQGINAVWLEVRVTNIRAKKFYMNRGFDKITTVKSYYGDGEDADIFYMTLSS